jgi:TPR repeat protein
MSSSLKEASLDVGGSSGGRAMLTWSLQANTDHFPYVFTVNANVGVPPANNLLAGNGFRTPVPAPVPALPVRMANASPAAEALWQRGTAYYDRNDFRNAFALYSQAAALGHPRAMAVLGTMYHDGEGVAKNPGQAVKWYTQAAMLGNRGAQYSLGAMYEDGDGVAKNVPKAAQLYEASARQGLPEAQFALGLSYEFGEGVPRNRRTAIFWLDQVAKQGDGRAKWYADWLSRPDTPQFRDEAELGRYTAGKVQQGIAAQMGVANRAPIGTLNGYGPTERSERAASLDAAGETNRASECRSSGHC